MAKEIKRSELVAAMKELNDFIDPEIDLKSTPERLKDNILKAAGVLEEDDEVSAKTQKVIDALTEEADEQGNAEDEAAENGKTEETEAPTNLTELVARTSKLKDLKAIVAKYDEFKKLRKGIEAYQGLSGPRELKPAMYKLLGVEPPARQTTKKEKVERGPSVFGTSVDFLCSTPGATREALSKALIKAGFTEEQTKGGAANTAWSSVVAIIKKLQAAGRMKK